MPPGMTCPDRADASVDCAPAGAACAAAGAGGGPSAGDGSEVKGSDVNGSEWNGSSKSSTISPSVVTVLARSAGRNVGAASWRGGCGGPKAAVGPARKCARMAARSSAELVPTQERRATTNGLACSSAAV